jgi:ATP-dependent helicase/nuclease subunit A
MTVHAAKGLEFPIVFVVNLARGASGPPDPVRIVVDGEPDAPSVSIGPFISETDEAERDREKQETRRLLYVAATRARDRLYFSSPLKDGVLTPGRGSLAEVLPESIKGLFNRAGEDADGLTWTAASGRVYPWRICRAPSSPDQIAEGPVVAAGTGPPDRLGPLKEDAVARRAVTEWIEEPAGAAAEPHGSTRGGITAGVLVHRLLQARSANLPADATAQLAFARTLLRPTECVGIDRLDAIVAEAVKAWRSLSTRGEVATLLSSGQVLHEVPFSLLSQQKGGSVILRGTIDCVVQKDDGSFVILEFKTGRPSPSHQRQLDLYVEAVTALFPAAQVVGQLVYAD